MLIRDEFNDDDCIGFGMLKEFFGEMRYQIDSEPDKSHEKVRRLRNLMAAIIRRERKGE